MKRLLTFAVAFLVTGISVLPGCDTSPSVTAVDLLDRNGEKGFTIKTIAADKRTRKFALFVPLSYDASRKYPTIIFLHGVGEGGGDIKKSLYVGLAPFVAARRADFPCICIFPQSDNGSWDENSQNAEDVIAILDQTAKEYAVDQDRVSLMGIHTGGYGAWAIGAKYKERFAALVPMASNANPSKHAGALINMPVRAFCNGGDLFGGFGGNDRGMVERIKILGGRSAEFTMTDDDGHNCWDGVYSSGDLFSWLMRQRRNGATAPVTGVTSSITPIATVEEMSGDVPGRWPSDQIHFGGTATLRLR